MRVEIIDEYPVGISAQQYDRPDYQVDLWDVSNGLEVTSYLVQDAIDAAEVEAWARERGPGRWVLFCVVPVSETETQYVRIGGYEAAFTGELVEDWVSNADDVRTVREQLGEYASLPKAPGSSVRYTAR